MSHPKHSGESLTPLQIPFIFCVVRLGWICMVEILPLSDADKKVLYRKKIGGRKRKGCWWDKHICGFSRICEVFKETCNENVSEWHDSQPVGFSVSDRIYPCWCVKYVCWCFRWQTDAAFTARLSSASFSGKTNLKLPSSLWATRATWSAHERSARRVRPLDRTLSLLY